MSNMRVGRQSGKFICWNCDSDDIRERVVINIPNVKELRQEMSMTTFGVMIVEKMTR